MKYLALTVFLIFFSQSSSGQTHTSNPYNDALSQFVVSYLDENSENNFSIIYILENEVTDSLMKSIKYKSRKVVISVVDNKQLLKGNIKSVLKILPIQMSEGKLTIDVIHFGVEIKRKKVKLINSLSGVGYSLEYDCSNQVYLVKKINDAD